MNERIRPSSERNGLLPSKNPKNTKETLGNGRRHGDITRRIIAIFLNNSNEPYTPKKINVTLKKTFGEINTGTVRGVLFKIKKAGIIKHIAKGYVLNNPNKALIALDNVSLLGPTPSPPLVVPHQGRFKVPFRLDELRYNMIQGRLSHAKPGDRAQNRVYRGEAVNVSISKDRKAVFYVTGSGWAQEINAVFGRDCLDFLLRQEMDFGNAISLEGVLGIKMRAPGLSVDTDKSQLAGGEVCVHGDEKKVKAFTYNLLKDTLDFTTFEGEINDKINDLARGQTVLNRAVLNLSEHILSLQMGINQVVSLLDQDNKDRAVGPPPENDPGVYVWLNRV